MKGADLGFDDHQHQDQLSITTRDYDSIRYGQQHGERQTLRNIGRLARRWWPIPRDLRFVYYYALDIEWIDGNQ